jgi:hypothetical protein
MNKMAKGRQTIHATQKVEATIREWQNAKMVLISMMNTPFDTKNRARHAAQIDISRRMLKIVNAVQRAYDESGIDATRSKHTKENATQVGQEWIFNSVEADNACAFAMNTILDSAVELDVPVFEASEIDGTDDFPGPMTGSISFGQRAAIDFLLTYPDAPEAGPRSYDTIDTFAATSGRGDLE